MKEEKKEIDKESKAYLTGLWDGVQIGKDAIEEFNVRIKEEIDRLIKHYER